jgi:hypothetical protein
MVTKVHISSVSAKTSDENVGSLEIVMLGWQI